MKKRKSVLTRLKKNIIATLLVGAFCVWAALTLVAQEVKLMELKKEEALYRANIEKLKKDIATMEQEIEKSQSPEFIERMAREKLKMVKPNETIYFIEGGQKKK